MREKCRIALTIAGQLTAIFRLCLVVAVFTQPGLEKDPTHQVPPSEMYLVPKPGTMQNEFATDEHHKLYNDTMTKWSDRVKQRRVLVKPVFQDFDKYVTVCPRYSAAFRVHDLEPSYKRGTL